MASDAFRIGWFCARCGRLVGYGEQSPKPGVHACASPYKEDVLPFVITLDEIEAASVPWNRNST